MAQVTCEKMGLDVRLTHDKEYFVLKNIFLFNQWKELGDF